MEKTSYIEMIENYKEDNESLPIEELNIFNSRDKESLFSDIVNSYEAKLLNVVNKIINDIDISKDIVQDTFLIFYEKGNMFEGRSSIYTWLYRIATNKSIDFIRKKVRERKYIKKISHTKEVVSDSHDNQIHEKIIVSQALSQLDETFRMPLILAEYENMSYAEIAQQLNIEINTVRTRIFRARKKMLSILKKNGVIL